MNVDKLKMDRSRINSKNTWIVSPAQICHLRSLIIEQFKLIGFLTSLSLIHRDLMKVLFILSSWFSMCFDQLGQRLLLSGVYYQQRKTCKKHKHSAPKVSHVDSLRLSKHSFILTLIFSFHSLVSYLDDRRAANTVVGFFLLPRSKHKILFNDCYILAIMLVVRIWQYIKTIFEWLARTWRAPNNVVSFF